LDLFRHPGRAATVVQATNASINLSISAGFSTGGIGSQAFNGLFSKMGRAV
jgi:hypothetical protein